MATRPEFNHRPSTALARARERAAASATKLADIQNAQHQSGRDMTGPGASGSRRPSKAERTKDDLTGGEADFAKVMGKTTDVLGVSRGRVPKQQKAQGNVSKKQGVRSDLRPLDLNIPITRPKRLTTEDGRTSFHFSHDAIMKTAHETVDDAGRTNRPGAAKAHNSYIERESAVAQTEADLAGGVGELDVAPVNDNEVKINLAAATGQQAYIERQEALAIQPDGTRVLFTNIDGNPAERAEFWRLVEKHERDPGPDRIVFEPAKNETFWKNVRRHPDCPAFLSKALDAADPGKQVSVKTEGNVEMRRFLSTIDGWIEVGKKEDGESDNEYAARRATAVAHFADGRGGRVQYRIIGELPYELEVAERAAILRMFAQEFEDRRLPYVAVMHAPDHTNSDKNWHFHLIYYDRPAARVTAADLEAYDRTQEEKGSRARRSDPKWIGRWNFDVKVREKKTDTWSYWDSYPFRSDKVGEVAQTNQWITVLRKRLAEITNNHLEKAGISRRLDARRHSEMGIHTSPQEHLGTRLSNLEAMGVATPKGISNEEIQWKATIERLEKGLTRRKNGVDRRAERWMQQLDRATLSVETKAATRADIIRWHQHQSEAEEHGAIVESVSEHMDRLMSRANKVKETCERHLEAIDKGSASRFQASRKGHLENKLADAEEYLKHVVVFLSDENELVRQCNDHRGREIAQADELALRIDGILNPRSARVRDEERDAEMARRASDTASAADEERRQALNKAQMDRWIEGIRLGHRRLVRRGRSIVPLNMVETDREIVGALNYSAMQKRLAGIMKAQDQVIADVVAQIEKNPLIVKPRVAGETGPAYTMMTPRPTLAEAFLAYGDDPAIARAREEALEARRRMVDRTRAHDALDAANRAQEAAKPAAAADRSQAAGQLISAPTEIPSGANDEQRVRRAANGVPRAIADRILSDVSDNRRRITIVDGVARIAPAALAALQIDSHQLDDESVQKRLLALADRQSRELKRLTAYVASHPDRITQAGEHLVLSPAAPREIVEIARAWKADEQVVEMMTKARDAHARAAEREHAATIAAKTDARNDSGVVPEAPRITTLKTDDVLREEAMAAARQREEDRRQAEEAARAKPKAPVRETERRKRTELSREEVERITRAAQPGQRHQPTTVHVRIDAWAKAVAEGVTAEDRRRLAAQILNDREARERLAEIDPELARRIRAEAERSKNDRQLGLDLGLTPKR